jgi:ElaB/YqjD/DUF883 family membrane-anchored ribosome-binding protein
MAELGMPSTTSTPATAPEPDRGTARRNAERKLSSARARLFARLDEVGRRVNKARDSVDIARMIREHPFTAVGIAFAAGLLVALPRSQSRIGGQVTGLVMGLAVTAARSAITDWVLARVGTPGADD